MYTKTGLKVRETNGGRSSSSITPAESGVVSKLPPLTFSPQRSRSNFGPYSLHGKSSCPTLSTWERSGCKGRAGVRRTAASKPGDNSRAGVVVTASKRSSSRGLARKDTSGRALDRSRSGDGVAVTRRVQRKRPEWDDSLRDTSQYKLTPEEAVQRKKALVSKHNTLVFGVRGALALSSRDEAAAVAAAVKVAAARVAARRPVVMDREHIRSAATRSHGATSGDRGRSRSIDKRRSRSRGKSDRCNRKKQSASMGDRDKEDTVAEEFPGILSGDVNDMTVSCGLDANTGAGHKGTGAANALGTDPQNLLDLSEIEIGIRDFSQRVLSLETDGEIGLSFGASKKSGQDEDSSTGEEAGDAPTTDVENDPDSVDDEERCRSVSRSTAGAFDQLNSPLPRLKAPIRVDRPGERVPCSKGDDKGLRADFRQKQLTENTDLLDRIQRLEVQVRTLQLPHAVYANSSGISNTIRKEAGTNEVEKTTDTGQEEEHRYAYAADNNSVRSVIEDLFSLSSRLLERVTAAENLVQEYFATNGGVGAGNAAAEEDGKEVRELRARADSILGRSALVKAVGKNANGIFVEVSDEAHPLDEDEARAPTDVPSLRIEPAPPTPAKLESKRERARGCETPSAMVHRNRSPSPLDVATSSRNSWHTTSRERPESAYTGSKDCWSEALNVVSTLVSKQPAALEPVLATPGMLSTYSLTPPMTADAASQQSFGGPLEVTAADKTPLNHAPSPWIVSSPRHQHHFNHGRRTRLQKETAPMDTVATTLRIEVGCSSTGIGDESKHSDNLGISESIDTEAEGERSAAHLPAPVPSKKPMHPFEGRPSMQSPRWVHQQRVPRSSSLVRDEVGGEDSGQSGRARGDCGVAFEFHSGTKRGEVLGHAAISGKDFEDGAGRSSANFASPAIGEWYTPTHLYRLQEATDCK